MIHKYAYKHSWSPENIVGILSCSHKGVKKLKTMIYSSEMFAFSLWLLNVREANTHYYFVGVYSGIKKTLNSR